MAARRVCLRASCWRRENSIALPASAVEAAPFFQPSSAVCGGCLRPTWFGRCRTVVCVISFSFGANSVFIVDRVCASDEDVSMLDAPYSTSARRICRPDP